MISRLGSFADVGNRRRYVMQSKSKSAEIDLDTEILQCAHAVHLINYFLTLARYAQIMARESMPSSSEDKVQVLVIGLGALGTIYSHILVRNRNSKTSRVYAEQKCVGDVSRRIVASAR